MHLFRAEHVCIPNTTRSRHGPALRPTLYKQGAPNGAGVRLYEMVSMAMRFYNDAESGAKQMSIIEPGLQTSFPLPKGPPRNAV